MAMLHNLLWQAQDAVQRMVQEDEQWAMKSHQCAKHAERPHPSGTTP
jgi:hypothetical protein